MALLMSAFLIILLTAYNLCSGSVIVPFWPLQMRPMTMTRQYSVNALQPPPPPQNDNIPIIASTAQLTDPVIRILLRTWRPAYPQNIVSNNHQHLKTGLPVSPPSVERMTPNQECAAGSNSLPVIHVRGTNYQIGYETGRLMREHIQSFYQNFQPMQKKFLPFIQTEKGQRVYEGYLDAVRRHLPQYLSEIQGLSDGSGVPFEQVFLMHIRSEVSIILRQGHYETPACSTVFVNRPDAELIGHNEDNDPGMKSRSYMVVAEVLAENGSSTVEHFTAFAYPGTLPGNAFSFNRAGIIFTANSLSPLEVPTGKIPRYVMNRALLSAECPEDVEGILNSSPGLSQGCSVNVVFTRHPNDTIKMRNYELLGSFDEKLNTVIDRQAAFPYDPSKPNHEGNGFLYHFNKYERIKVKQNPENIVSSVHRQNRAKQFPIPTSLEDVIAVLGDTADADFPIYRTPNEKDGGCTIAVGIFDIKRMTLSVYKDNPKTSAPLVVMDMPKLY